MIPKYRFWDYFNEEMVYSEQRTSLSEFFKSYEDRIEGENKLDLMQYTGLKDKNGKEIYERDIIKSKSGILYEVIHFCGAFRFNSAYPTEFAWNLSTDGYDGAYTYDLEVIGNIYENPELLKN